MKSTLFDTIDIRVEGEQRSSDPPFNITIIQEAKFWTGRLVNQRGITNNATQVQRNGLATELAISIKVLLAKNE